MEVEGGLAMNKEAEGLDSANRLGALEDFDAQLLAAFSKTSMIGLAVVDSQQRFRFVNNTVAAMHHGIPAEAFVGNTMRDILGDAAPGPEARLRRALIAGETPSVEVKVNLPTRTEPGYWIEKNFTIKRGSGRPTQVASLAVEVTAQRRLEQHFRKLGGELLSKNPHYQRLARELHDSINQYHAALGMSLQRLSLYSTKPERIPEIWAQSMDFLDEPMRKLELVVAKCFPIHQQF
jgi:signal transduction histidine kinase